MISKVCSGHSFGGAVRYILQQSKKGEILASEGIRTYNTKVIVQDFERQQGFRPEKKQACFHGILSFYPGEKPSDSLIREIGMKYLESLGIKDTQHLMVKHTDRAHVHVHLIANLVNNQGMSISDKFIGLRGKKSAQQLTTAYNLKKVQAKTLSKTELKNLRMPEQYQYKIYAAVNSEIRKASSVDDLKTRLVALGIQMDFKYKGKTQERQGVSFRLGEYCFKGSQLDRNFSYGNLKKHFSEKLSASDILTKPVRNDLSQKPRIVVMKSIEPAHRQQDPFHSGILEAIFRQEQDREMKMPYELRYPQKPKPKHRPKL